MSDKMVLLVIFLSGVITFGLRLLPFIVFGGKKQLSPRLQYIGKQLPYAVMAMLVVYCLKGVGISNLAFSLIELGAVVITVIVHLWKKNLILSISVGTIVYMLLIHII